MQTINYTHTLQTAHTSRWVDRLYYDSNTGTLYIVTKNDSLYGWETPYAVWLGLVTAYVHHHSIGGYINSEVKGKYKFVVAPVYASNVRFVAPPAPSTDSHRGHTHVSTGDVPGTVGDFSTGTSSPTLKFDEDPRALRAFVVTVRVEAKDGWDALGGRIEDGELISLVAE